MVVSKTPEMNYYSSHATNVTPNSYPNQSQASYLNQNSYSNQKMHYQANYQPKDQAQSAQYGQFSEAQNETYRGSEGPPAVQVNIKHVSCRNLKKIRQNVLSIILVVGVFIF